MKCSIQRGEAELNGTFYKFKRKSIEKRLQLKQNFIQTVRLYMGNITRMLASC